MNAQLIKSLDERRNVAGAVFSLAISITVYLANRNIAGPMIQADEGSYLANAAAIAGFGNDFASSYSAGYSILIAPAFLIGSGPAEVWNWVIAINASLYFALVFGLWQLSPYLYNGIISLREKLFSVMIVAAYPMWVAMAGYSFSQLAFAAFFVWSAVFLFNAIEGKSLGGWALFSIVTGYLYWIHPTGAAVALVGVISAVIASFMLRDGKPAIVTICLILIMIVGYRVAFQPWLLERMTLGSTPNLHYPGVTEILAPLWHSGSWVELISRAGGHVFYLTIGTVGLALTGIAGLYSSWPKALVSEVNSGYKIFQPPITIYLILAPLSILVLSVLLFTATPEATRLDHWMYGRYVEGAIAPVILAGALALRWNRIYWAIPVAVVSAALMSISLGDYGHTARFNISTFWQDFFIRELGLWWWLFSGCALLVIAAIAGRQLGRAMILVFFVFCSWLQLTWHEAASIDARKRADATAYVREYYAPGTCVGFDHSGIDSYNKHVFWFDFGFYLYDYPLERMGVSTWRSRCNGPLFSYDRALDAEVADATLAAISPHGGPLLWAKETPFVATYPFSVEERSDGLIQILKSGWHDLESRHVWSSHMATLALPKPESCASGECHATIVFNVFGASSNRPVEVRFLSLNCSEVQNFLFDSHGPHHVSVPFNLDSEVTDITIEVPNSVSPEQLNVSSDSRVLGIALLSVDIQQHLD